MSRRLVTHAVFAYDVQPAIGDGGRVWTCLSTGSEIEMYSFAAWLRKHTPGRQIEVRQYTRRRDP